MAIVHISLVEFNPGLQRLLERRDRLAAKARQIHESFLAGEVDVDLAVEELDAIRRQTELIQEYLGSRPFMT